MRRPRLVIGQAIAVLCAVSMAIAAMSARAQRGAVRIHVMDIDSTVPILRARLAAASTTPLAPTFTDRGGNAMVDAPPPGRTLRISKPGYAPQAVSLDGSAEVIEVQLARGASIGGRVADALGAPVASRTVRIEAGATKEQPPHTISTNDLGEYRVGSLPDGTYSVSLMPVTASANRTVPAADAVTHTVVVRRGDEVGGIDFTVPRVTCANAGTPGSAAPAFGFGSISGRVVTTGGMPVPCVEVAALRNGQRVATTITLPDGSYTLQSLRAGSYPIEFKRSGYATLQWGQQQTAQPGRPVLLRDRENLRNIDIRLPRGGAITGTVFDEFGEPADNVTLRALDVRGEIDRPMAVAVGTAITDDRGRYRVFGLLPGRYIIATAAASEARDPRTGKGYAPAYYRGATEIASAEFLELREEQERQSIDFGREPVRVATVMGTAVNSRNEPVTDRVILVASQRSGAVIAETQGAEVKGADGAFTISNVPPGDYVVQATTKRPDAEGKEFGMQYVTVYQEDPPAVRIKTAAGVDVRGRLIEEGLPAVDARSFALTAIPVDWDHTSVLAGMETVTPADDGTISMLDVFGPRRFVLSAAPANWYLKSIRALGRDVADEVAGFPLSGFGFVRDMVVIASNQGATVEGDVMDGSSPAGDFSVVLFSSNPNHWFRNSRLVKSVRGDRGRFRIAAGPDGDYFLAAVDPLDGAAGGAWQDRDFLQSLIAAARRVRLREGDERSLTLTMTRR